MRGSFGRFAFGIAIAATLLAGCGGSGGINFGGSGNVTLVNASDVSPVVPFIDSVPVGSVTYGSKSTITLATGSYDFRFQAVGGSSDLFTSGSAQPVDENGRHFLYLTQVGRLTWNSGLFPTSTETVINAVNGSNATVDLYVTSGGTSLTSPVQKFANAASGTVNVVKVALGAYRVIATTPGTSTVIADSGSKSLSGGTYGSFVLTNGSGTTEVMYVSSL